VARRAARHAQGRGRRRRIGGTALAILLARAGMDVQLGSRTAAAADRIAAAHENADYLPGLALPDNVTPTTLNDIEFAGADLVVFAVPSCDLPAAVGSVGARIGDRTSVLVLSKGLVGPFGALPTHYVADRVDARAIAFLGGPAHAAEAVERGASVVLATTDADLQQQLGQALTKAGLYVEASDDVAGVELAGVAKNAATIAAAAAASDGANAAGAAAAAVFREVYGLAREHGARGETFIGLAGAGDLVATACAEHSRNRRAGELLGLGVPSEQISARVPQAAEGMAFVPLLVDALGAAGIDAPATRALGELVAGRIDRRMWLDSVRAQERAA
jgi:glycerol-3-phosphate dehydrogenase (NAD(P)+)